MTAQTAMFAALGYMEIIMIAVVVLLFFGAKRLPDIFKGMGQGIKEFKKASREVTEDVQRAMDEEPPPPPQRKPAEPAKPSGTGAPPESKA